MSRKKKLNRDLRRLQSSLTEIASLLDSIEGRPHPLLRASAEQLTPHVVPTRESLEDYTQHFATTLAKAGVSLK
jgi:hypothetical protein